MWKHDQGPRVFFVKSHARWLHGDLHHVEAYFRTMSPPLGFRHSALQLTFGF
jgi:hypothetical protein